MPSGRWKGPEKRSRTVLEARFDSVVAFVAIWTLGNPGGWSWPVSRAATATGELAVGADGFQGNTFSSKYTSEVSTTRGMLGTYTLYAPGVVRLRPRLMPTHARGSIRVFE
eukprot:6212343-Pleurochrysis_carterae.AAC.1